MTDIVGHYRFDKYQDMRYDIEDVKTFCERLKKMNTKEFNCVGAHCGDMIKIPEDKLNELLWTRIKCPNCGRSYILAYNEEEQKNKPKGYYIEEAYLY